MKIKKETCEFVPVTQLVPDKWLGWFVDMLSQDAPFSWGDNNRTLITVERFVDHVKECLDIEQQDDSDGNPVTQAEVDKWVAEIEKLDPLLYVDLEN